MNKSSLFITHIKENILLYILILSAVFLFFYRLDYQALSSWDEAWYGSIARQMNVSGDYLIMNWNGKPYYDHPPMGFWLIAISYKLFGINEFATRFPSALLSVFSLLLLYFIGIRLFGKKVIGFVAALILATSVWYIIRVRSGNLDAMFVFFYLATIYFSIRAKKTFRWFPVAMGCFAALMLTKTLVGLSAIPLILFITFSQLIRVQKNWLIILAGIGIFFLIAAPWYMVNNKAFPDFIQHHIYTIGTRDKSIDSYFKLQYEQPLFYLHMGVRKWYYLWIVGFTSLVVTLRFVKKNVFLVILWNTLILYPFLTTSDTHIWHLIPVYVPLALATSGGIYYLGMTLFDLVRKVRFLNKNELIKSLIKNELMIHTLYLFAFLVVAFMQIKIFYNEVIPQNRSHPDDVDIALKAGKYNKTIFFDDDYLPIAVFYSGKNMRQMAYEPEERKTLVKLFTSSENDFIVITRNWALNNLDEAHLEYQVLEKNNSFSILARP